MKDIVDGLVTARRQRTLYKADFSRLLSEVEAYAIQDGVAAALGFRDTPSPRAWKAGGREHMTSARLPRVLQGGGEWNMEIDAPLIVEAEVSLRLARAPQGDEPIEACIGTMCASIEIVSTRMVDGLKAPPVWKTADQQLHACSILGAAIPYARRDWAGQRGTLIVDGHAREFTGTHPNGDPAQPVAWLAQHATARGQPLGAGDVIMTGAWAIAEASPGNTIEVRFDGIGAAVVRIASR